jgi:hypothetical protein
MEEAERKRSINRREKADDDMIEDAEINNGRGEKRE